MGEKSLDLNSISPAAKQAAEKLHGKETQNGGRSSQTQQPTSSQARPRQRERNKNENRTIRHILHANRGNLRTAFVNRPDRSRGNQMSATTPDVAQAIERLEHECLITADPESGLAKDILTVCKAAQAQEPLVKQMEREKIAAQKVCGTSSVAAASFSRRCRSRKSSALALSAKDGGLTSWIIFLSP